MSIPILKKRKIDGKIFYYMRSYSNGWKCDKDLLKLQKKRLKSQGFNVRSLPYCEKGKQKGWDLFVNRGTSKSDPRIADFITGEIKGGDINSLPGYTLIWTTIKFK